MDELIHFNGRDYFDDRLFILDLAQVTIQKGNQVPERRWAVITRRNVPGYPPCQTDDFNSRDEAVRYLHSIAPMTPRISLGGRPPNPVPSLSDFKNWLASSGLAALPEYASVMADMSGATERPQGERGIDQQALLQAAESIRLNFGDVSDLPEELANTLANLYYKFHLLGKDPDHTSAISADSYVDFMNRWSTILLNVKYAPEMIRNIRETRAKNPDIFDYLVRHYLDDVKYQMDHDLLANASELERARFRNTSKVDEVANLAALMKIAPPPEASGPEPFAWTPTMPDVTRTQPFRAYRAKGGALLLLLLRNVPSVASDMTYPLVMAAIDTSTRRPKYFVTSERSSVGAFICGFSPDGAHINFGRPTDAKSEKEFIETSLSVFRSELGFSRIEEIQKKPRSRGGMFSRLFRS